MEDTPFSTIVSRLRHALAAPLPGLEAQLRMSPAHRSGRQDPLYPDVGLREGAVLVAIYPALEEPMLVLTRRPDTLPDHPGQISLPGGRRDGDEPLEETALREAWEEVGIQRDSVEILGPLSPLHIPHSNYLVYPYVGVLRNRPPFRRNPAEVAEMIEVPLRRLTDDGSRRRAIWPLHGRDVEVPYYEVSGHAVWGATAMMLSELVALLTG